MINKLILISNITVKPYVEGMAILKAVNLEGLTISYYKESDFLAGIIHLESNDDSIICIMIKAEILSYDLCYRYSVLSEEEKRLQIDKVKEYLSLLLTRVRKQTDSTILFYSFELPTYSNDFTDSKLKKNTFSDLNHYIDSEIHKIGKAFLIDADNCLRDVGVDNYYNYKHWYLACNPYTRLAYTKIFTEYKKYIDMTEGNIKKCIVLDCDYVLWGGIIGEDGINGIKISKDYPGRAYFDFQNKLVELNNMGYILALCSKNNEQDVLNVFQRKKEMPLSMCEISAYRINWNDKVSNIISLAEELNIGLESMIFIDDSEYEIQLVKTMLPQVGCLLLPQNKPEEYFNILLRSNHFNTLNTKKDIKRSDLYRQNKERTKYKVNFDDVDMYYQSLKTKIQVMEACKEDLGRVSELSFRTNQFNLSFQRYYVEDLEDRLQSPHYKIFCLYVKDIFGDLGLVGASIIYHENEENYIENIIMSCRALGRKIEELFLDILVKFFVKISSKNICAYFSTKDKNVLARNLFEDKGFLTKELKDKRQVFYLDTCNYRFSANRQLFDEINIRYGGSDETKY